MILCGQHSLEIFCLGIFLAFAGHFVLAEVGGGAFTHALVSLAGILIMWGVAWVISWYKHSADKDASKAKRTVQCRYGWRQRMRPGSGAVLALSLLAGIAAAGPGRAQDAPRDAPQAAPQACEVPAYLLNTDSLLPRVTEAVKNGRPLNILVVGSRSSTIASSADSAYPAKLLTALKQKLPSTPIDLSVELQGGKTAEETDAILVKLVEAKKPTLVIWQTGTVDAMRSVDPDDFRAAVGEGVAALQKAGADVVLINLQYSPRTETMISAPPYLDNMRVVAQQYGVPLFDRFAIMRHWNDAGDFDLFSTFHGPDMAKRVHACLGRALSKFVFDAARLDPAQQN